jgi:hypothetical protein
MMKYKDTLDKIAAKAAKITLPEPLHLMVEINHHFLSYFYVSYEVDDDGFIEILDVEVDSFAPEFQLFTIEPLSNVLDKFIVDCLERL